jgi:hypothetical protein
MAGLIDADWVGDCGDEMAENGGVDGEGGASWLGLSAAAAFLSYFFFFSFFLSAATMMVIDFGIGRDELIMAGGVENDFRDCAQAAG